MLEPVAWMYADINGHYFVAKERLIEYQDQTETPLYALPEPAADLVEVVSRAICCARARCEGCNGDGAGGCFELSLWDEEARAAILALKEQPHEPG